MRNTSLSQTVKAKVAFEKEMEKYNAKVQFCRAENEQFAEKGFQDEISNCNHVITYCGVSAYH